VASLQLLIYVVHDILYGYMKISEALLPITVSLAFPTILIAIFWALLLAMRNARQQEREGNGNASWVEFKARNCAVAVRV